MNCPHCSHELVQHPADAGASKAGAWHCDGCGCCFRGGKPREGAPLCAIAGDGSGEALPPLPDEAYPEGATALPEPTKPRRGRGRGRP